MQREGGVAHVVARELQAPVRGRGAGGLQRHAHIIQRVTVRLEDETGPQKDGVDKVCSIELKLHRGADVRIRELGEDFEAVIDVALDRARTALGRVVSRTKRGVGEG